ncbi:MAG: hypothetical protein ACK4WM_03430 [Thermoflexales bacterium]
MQTLNPPARRRARIALTLFTLAFAFATAAGLIYWRRDELAGLTWRLRPEYFALSAAMFGLALLLVVWLWARLLRALGQPLPFTTHLRYFGMANLAKRLPGTLWYVAGRAYLYRQVGVSPALVALASGLEVIIATLANLLVAVAFAGPTLLSYLNANVAAIPAITLATILGLVLIHPRAMAFMIEKVERRRPEAIPSYDFLVTQVVLSTGVWIFGGLMFYAICAALTEIESKHIFYVVGVWALSSLLSSLILFLPANLGAKEISGSLLLAAIMPLPAALAVAVLSRLLVTAYEVCWALAAVWAAKFPGQIRHDTPL